MPLEPLGRPPTRRSAAQKTAASNDIKRRTKSANTRPPAAIPRLSLRYTHISIEHVEKRLDSEIDSGNCGI